MSKGEEIKKGMTYEIARAAAEATKQALTGLIQSGGEHLNKKMETFFKPKGKLRVIYDDVIDNLYFYLNNHSFFRRNTPADKKRKMKWAALRMKVYLRQARRKNIENEVVAALVEILFLDPAGENLQFPQGHKNAAFRYYQLATKPAWDFWQSIETYVDDPGKEKIRAAWQSVKGLPAKVKPVATKVKNGTIKIAIDTKDAVVAAEKKNRANIDAENVEAKMSPFIKRMLNKSRTFNS